jgi:ABC-type multidrug transport system fused ATPase/permease subunit
MEYANGISEAVRVAEETRVFGVAAAQRGSVERLNQVTASLFFRTQLLARLVPGTYQSLIYVFVVGGLALLYGLGAPHAASLGAVVLLLVRAGTYGQQAQAAYHYVRQSLPYLDRLQKAQRRYESSSKPSGTLSMDPVTSLRFQNVSFAYDAGRPVLRDVTFEIAGREAIGIVGPSGAGKSTLVQILLGLRSPDTGEYLVNGVPADRIAREEWQRRVAYVPQEPRLLHASVAENIRYFRPLEDSAVERAGRLAGIHDEVTSWRDGYETLIGPRADAVSGGQQQRLCLARALAGLPEVLVLDEPTSALDPHSESLIRDSLAALRHELTVIIVAHRMSTLEICERAMVVVGGQLEAFATTTHLQRNSAYYRSATALAAGGSAL